VTRPRDERRLHSVVLVLAVGHVLLASLAFIVDRDRYVWPVLREVYPWVFVAAYAWSARASSKGVVDPPTRVPQ
jgi:hypothetical protein